MSLKWGEEQSSKQGCTETKGIWSCDDWVDAWDLSKFYSCNESPNIVVDFNAIDCDNETTEAEVNRNGERFWTRIIDCPRCEIILAIVIDDVLKQPFSKGDTIQYELRNIYNIRSTGSG